MDGREGEWKGRGGRRGATEAGAKEVDVKSEGWDSYLIWRLKNSSHFCSHGTVCPFQWEGVPSPPEEVMGPLPQQTPRHSPAHNLSQLENIKPVHLCTAHHCQLSMFMLLTIHHPILMSCLNNKWRDTLDKSGGESPQWTSWNSTLIPWATRDLSW